MDHPAPNDSQAFRAALGSFATGVTIATTMSPSGDPIGVTASSFNSVSLDPPLVLWSLSKKSLSLPAFAASGHFAIHILAADQSALSDRFALSQSDKWEGLNWHEGTCGSPLLDQHAAVFECLTAHEYDGGDHVILVGEVISYKTHDRPPLLFHGGQYSDSRKRQDPDRFDPNSVIAMIEHAGFIAHHCADPQALETKLKDQFPQEDLNAAKAVLRHLIAQISGQDD